MNFNIVINAAVVHTHDCVGERNHVAHIVYLAHCINVIVKSLCLILVVSVSYIPNLNVIKSYLSLTEKEKN